MSIQITVCLDQDFTGQSRRVFAVAAGANTDLSIDTDLSTPGWVEVDEDENQSGNPVSGIKRWATLATYSFTTPGDDVSLVVNSTVDCDLQFVDCGNGPL